MNKIAYNFHLIMVSIDKNGDTSVMQPELCINCKTMGVNTHNCCNGSGACGGYWGTTHIDGNDYVICGETSTVIDKLSKEYEERINKMRLEIKKLTDAINKMFSGWGKY